MTNVTSTDTSDQSLTRDILDAARYYLGGRRTLVVLTAILIVGGIASNWGWLVAIGLAPVLISLLPCAAMCALGLCMHKMAGGDKTGRQNAVAGSTQTLATVNSQYPVVDTSDLIDPVSQRVLPAATPIASVHQGRIYYFEERANRDAFETEPERYLTGSQLVGRPVAASDISSEHSHKGQRCCG